MMVIGITGGIGTGKSTAAACLREKGLAHIDADEISRQLTRAGSPMLPVIDEAFGPGLINGDGDLDRKALASIVFSDRDKRERLEEIMFDAIIEEIAFRIDRAKEEGRARAVLLDAPLLFEAGLDTMCDCVLLLTADEDMRIKRVMERDGVTDRDVRNRINSQMGDEEKLKRADFSIDNSGSEGELYEKLDKFLKTVVRRK